MRAKRVILAIAVAAAPACGGDTTPPPAQADYFAAMGEPLPTATAEQKATFVRGKKVAERVFTPEEGLGPLFNVASCAHCHEKPATGGSSGRYRNFLIIGQRLGDGSFTPTGVNGIQTLYTLTDQVRVPGAENTNVSATRNPIAFFGLGLLAEIPEAEILKHADPDDADGDGISGRPNYDRGFVSRFGRKAQTASLEGFIRGPIFNHMGVTSTPLTPERKAALPVPSAAPAGPAMVCGHGCIQLQQAAAPDMPNHDDDAVPDPELSEGDLFDVVSFTMLLAPPRPDPATPETEAGRALFEKSGCVGCHLPSLTGPRGPIPAYTDLLIHDMGPDLADGIKQLEATGSEFRTAPLWGVVSQSPYLHDGRADTLDQAIRWHGGEAARARDAYVALTDAERGQVVAFLESLGGRSQHSSGLLPPGAPIPAPGEYGGPDRTLNDAERDVFEKGREVFDRDIALGAGLGPLFNGDSCRACHFQPVIGGAGPLDVNAIRHGVFDRDSGVFTAPVAGTISHRQTTTAGLAQPIQPDVNCFEGRQTPPLFGLGLLDEVPDEAIMAAADPDDLDGDGVSGRAHVLPDGRVGRFGWKADVPSLHEFARDGMLNEMGVTVPDEDGQTYGANSDDDDSPDPELSREDLDAVVAYMKLLAPPPRTRVEPAVEDQGEAVFTEIGCATCHTPVLFTAAGRPVPAYTDLLLHRVLADDMPGISSLGAGPHDFRTAPLWGLAKSGPYLHDGRATTVEQAIMHHDGEARGARESFITLDAAKRDALIAFLKSL